MEAEIGYFINKEGIVKKCSDEIEGITNCHICEFNSDLQCYNCSSNSYLQDNKCIIKDIEGCIKYRSSYNCLRCDDNYIFVSKLGICVKKIMKMIYAMKQIL